MQFKIVHVEGVPTVCQVNDDKIIALGTIEEAGKALLARAQPVEQAILEQFGENMPAGVLNRG